MSDPETRRERLTILAVYPWPDFWSMGEGSGAPSFHLSVTAFPAHGHEMHVLLPGSPHGPAEEHYDGVRLHRMRTRVNFYPEVGLGSAFQHVAILFAYLWWLALSVPAAFRLAARLRPDVVIGMGSLGAPVARAVGRARGVPNVTRLFGTELGTVRGDRLRFALRYRDVAAYRTGASYIVACNDGSGSDEVARSLGVDVARFRHWYNGVDKRRYMNAAGGGAVRRRFGIPESNLVVLSVSRLHREKRVDRLLRAAPGVLERVPDTTFLIVGGGEEEAALRAAAGKLGVLENVVFTGALSRDELPDVYASADVFVTLSDRTNVLNPLHEAMIAGVAVVALDTGGTSEIVRDGETGVLVGLDDLPDLPRVLADLLSDRELRSALGAAARESADKRLPTFEERQAMEVEIVERAVREHESARAV
jgi:glycosyltransferase involved in cell wall biosynthesis